MDKKQFYSEYKEVFNLDNVKWDMPKFGVKGFVKNLPFKIQVSIKNEIDMDSLFYVMGGNIYHLDLVFLRPELDDRTRFPDIKIGKLNAIEIDSVYLTKHELDVKPSFKFNTRTVETLQFPIMDKDVKPIDDYVEKKEEYDIITTSIKVNISKEDNLKLNKVRTFLEDNKNKIDAMNALGKFSELETFEAINSDLDLQFKPSKEQLSDNEDFIKNQLENIVNNVRNKSKINERFNDCIDNRLNDCKKLLLVKSLEYRRNDNPYHNFNVGAKFTGESSEKVLYGFLLKHLISLQDIVNDVNESKLPSKEIIAAKVSDIINYMLILEALIEERRNNNDKNI